MHIDDISTKGQFRSGAQPVYPFRIERYRVASSVHLQQIAAGFVVEIGVIVLSMPLYTVLPTLLAKRIVTASKRIAGVIITRTHTRYALQTHCRVIRTITTEILAEEQGAIGAQRFLTRFGINVQNIVDAIKSAETTQRIPQRVCDAIQAVSPKDLACRITYNGIRPYRVRCHTEPNLNIINRKIIARRTGGIIIDGQLDFSLSGRNGKIHTD